MRFARHEITAKSLAALAAGGGGPAVVRSLAAAQYSKHVLFVWGVMDTARAVGHPQARLAFRGYELLAEIQRQAPHAVETVLSQPAVGGWAERTLRALGRGAPLVGSGPADRTATADRAGAAAHPGPVAVNEPALLAQGTVLPPGQPAQLAAIAAAAAIRASYPCTIEVPVHGGLISLPSVGQAVVSPGPDPDGLANVRCGPGGAQVIVGRQFVVIPGDTDHDGSGWHGMRAIQAAAGPLTIRLLIDDLDPFRMPAAAGLGGRLDSAEVERWQAVLRDALPLLAGQPSTTAAEIQAAIRVLTPLREPVNGQLSASSGEVFGCVALSPPSDGRSLAVTLAHEVQHAKLVALLDLVPLTRPDDGRRYYAAWRDDPRPLAGLLQGAYAYLGVGGFWRWQRLREAGPAAVQAHAEFARWRDAATAAAETLLDSGGLTEAGTVFVSGMLGTLRGWADDMVPGTALEMARQHGEHHLAHWRRRNGDPSKADNAGNRSRPE